jgi:hypothetical protein
MGKTLMPNFKFEQNKLQESPRSDPMQRDLPELALESIPVRALKCKKPPYF